MDWKGCVRERQVSCQQLASMWDFGRRGIRFAPHPCAPSHPCHCIINALQITSLCYAMLGLKLRVIDNATHPRPEMPKKRKRGGRKRKWDKRNAPESLIAIPWERQVSHELHLMFSFPHVHTKCIIPVSTVATEWNLPTLSSRLKSVGTRSATMATTPNV